MNPQLKLARDYYDRLPQEAKEKVMPKHLLAAIQIAEKMERELEFNYDALKFSRELCDEIMASETALKKELARVTKP